MNEVERYESVGYDGLRARMVKCKYGDYVHLEDYDALLAEMDELLVALQACVDYGSMTGDESITDNAIAAIAKARGDV